MGVHKVLLVIFLVGVSSVCVAADSHGQHANAYDDILDTMMLNHSLGMRLQNLTTLLKRLELHNCTNNTNHHHKCVTATSLFDFYNISTTKSLEESDFEKISTVILYSLLPPEDHHSADEKHKSEDHDVGFSRQRVEVYSKLLERYETSGLCEQILDRLLKDVNESIGEQLVNSGECFSTHDILHDMNISHEGEITKEDLPKFSTIIVSKLLERHCIKVEHKTQLPCTFFFVKKLFNKYANNNTVNKEKIEELLKTLNIGKPGSTEEETDDGHDHRRRRRSLPNEINTMTSNVQEIGHGRYRREAEDHKDEHAENTYEKCYSANELFAIYQVDEKTGFKIDKFGQLSSALVHQIDSNACVTKDKDGHTDENSVDSKEKWGYGLLAVAIISLCSIIGVSVIPFITTILYQKAVVFLISLAVGTLVGDALLHLLPHSLGFHDHEHGGKDKTIFWKFLVALAGIYGFFLFETVTHLFLQNSIGHSHSVEPDTQRRTEISEHSHSHAPHENGGYSPEGNQPAVVLTNMANVEENGSADAKTNNHCDGDVEAKTVEKTIKSVAWMVIIGDVFHNVADGIAIGVAFSGGTVGGISTSIAVFCHELPHELGDFAVLLSAGLSVKQALLANFLTACSCFIGFIFGILIGEIEDVNLWIFALTAGLFVYIALTDMLPELMHNSDFNQLSKLSRFSLKNAGILLGFTIMILLAYFEEDIRV